MDMNKHTLGIDIRDFEMESLLEPQSEVINGREEASHGWLPDHLEENLHLVDRDHGREFKLAFDSEESQRRPVAWTSELEEAFESTLGDVDGTTVEVFLVPDIEEVLAEIVFGS